MVTDAGGHSMYIVFAVCAWAAAATPPPEGRPTLSFESRIIGGAEENIANYPHQASLRFSGSHTCGCVVMSANKVLTAAHCTQ